MKSLYNENQGERLTEEGHTLDQECYALLEPLFQKWIDFGFKIREIQYTIDHCCLDISLNKLLFDNKKKND
jgi:hypothetical protein